ncbi:MAG: sigma-54-dependent Fis family transcriptional regulator [Spirochaetales bacterium]|nr:sigma-54-dependent Fis family transcriptional regulator [Spirochaetales bacterium]
MSDILIIDDEPGIRTVLTDILEDEHYTVFTAGDGFEGLAVIRSRSIDLVILDVWLPNMGGMDVLKQIKEEFPEIEVILISGHANIDIAVKAVKLGAFDFLEKPLSLDKVVTLTRNALKLEELKKENRNLKNSLFVEDEMIGEGPHMIKVRERIRQSAGSDVKVLILGENGTGKELVAREIHRQSKRADKPFVEVNCAAIPDTLIESELFGHEKGSFTNAVSRRKGKFELADGGTLFLDEIADMSLNAQAKVLRVIQEMKFERIGGEKSISVDVRIIAATNKDIATEVKQGRFREDLYFRLNVVPIQIPPLRERKEDLVPLITYFMQKFNSSTPDQEKSLSSEALEVLSTHPWPGNIRELKNFIERITIMSDEDVITKEVVEYFLGDSPEEESGVDYLKEFEPMKLNEAKDQFEKQLITRKLEQNSFNISQTAQILGLYPSNLHGKIKKHGIKIEK